VVGKTAEIHKFAGWHSGLHTHMRYHTHTHEISHSHTEAEGGAQMSVTERRSPLSNSCGPLVGTVFFLSVGYSTTGTIDVQLNLQEFIIAKLPCVDFGYTHAVQLRGWFEVYPSTCWVSSQNMNVR